MIFRVTAIGARPEDVNIPRVHVILSRALLLNHSSDNEGVVFEVSFCLFSCLLFSLRLLAMFHMPIPLGREAYPLWQWSWHFALD